MPQGRVLSPLIFVLYVSDLEEWQMILDQFLGAEETCFVTVQALERDVGSSSNNSLTVFKQFYFQLNF